MLYNISYKNVGVKMNKNHKEIEIIDIENTYMFAKSEIEKLKKRIEAVNLQKKEDEKKEQIIFLLKTILAFVIIMIILLIYYIYITKTNI